MMVERSVLPFVVFTFLFTASGSWGQGYQPSRPIELVVHSAPGGGSDVFARAVVEMVQTEKLLPLPVRVVNKTEGASVAAMAYMVEKAGDDHTLAVFTNTWVATPLTNKDAKYSAKDMTPVVRLVLEPTIAVVRADSPYKNMNDFVEAAKRDPGSLKQAGGSATAIESLTGLLIQSATGATWAFVSTPAVKDRIANLLSGNVQIIIPQPQDVNEHIAAGKVRPIAALTEKRLTVLPNVPTIKEQGINVPIIANARGVLAPPRIGSDVIGYWENFFARLIKTPSWKKYVEENQVEDVFLKSPEVSAFLDEQITLMRSVLQMAGVPIAR
jgi:putative tricarboxylic transport membrane protein